MTITVSISDFRNNLSDYLRNLRLGHKIVLKDEKKDEEVAEIIGKKKFDVKAYHAMLKRVAGSMSGEDHPEWATRAKVEKWLRKTRKNAERHFDVHA